MDVENQIIFGHILKCVVFQEVLMLWIEKNLEIDLLESLFLLETPVKNLLNLCDACFLRFIEIRVKNCTLILVE